MKVTIDDVKTLRDVFAILKRDRQQHSSEYHDVVWFLGNKEEGTIEIAHYNGGGELRSFPVKGTVHAQGHVCVDLIGFEKLVARPHRLGGNLTIAREQDGDVVRFTHERLEFQIEAVRGLGVLPAHTTTESHNIKAGYILRAFESCVRAARRDPRMYKNLCGVHLNKGYAEATDVHRMRVVKFPGSEPLENVVVPVNVVGAVVYAMKRMKIEGDVDIEISLCEGKDSERFLRFGFPGGGYVMTPPVEGEFVDTDRLDLPASPENRLYMMCGDFLEALDIVSPFVPSHTKEVVLSVDTDALRISALNVGIGEGETECAVEYEGPQVRVGFNVKYLEEALKDLGKDARIMVQITDPLAPAILQDVEAEEKELWVIMPRKLK